MPKPRNSRETKYCALLDKPCLKNKCALHFDKFERCSLELTPHNLYPLTVATQELVEIDHELTAAVNSLIEVFKKSSELKELFN